MNKPELIETLKESNGLSGVEDMDIFDGQGTDRVPFQSKKRRPSPRSSARQIRNLQGPVIIAGDFNDGPGRGPLGKRFDQPDTIGILEKNFKQAAGDERPHEGGFNIDYVMVRNASASRRTVIPTPWRLSDHRPVWAGLKSGNKIFEMRT